MKNILLILSFIISTVAVAQKHNIVNASIALRNANKANGDEVGVLLSEAKEYIDQAQSLNLNIPADLPVKEVNNLILEAWRLGVKTLYYQRSQSVSKEMVTNLVSCSSCEG